MAPPKHRRQYHQCELIDSVNLQSKSGTSDRALGASETLPGCNLVGDLCPLWVISGPIALALTTSAISHELTQPPHSLSTPICAAVLGKRVGSSGKCQLE